MALILVFQAEPVVATVCSAILENAGFSVYATGSSARAFEFFGRENPAIEAVIADVSLALNGGADLARRIFRLHSGAAVVLTTTHERVPDDLQAVCAVLRKPFTSRDLVTGVRAAIRSRARLSPAARTPLSAQ